MEIWSIPPSGSDPVDLFNRGEFLMDQAVKSSVPLSEEESSDYPN